MSTKTGRFCMWSGFASAIVLLGAVTAAATEFRVTTPDLRSAHTDVLFIGAHPDDEFQSLSTFGQWRENKGLSVGVATITRGEGGGNAVGPQEGVPLGLLREDEERRAVSYAGIRNVFYLDRPDFWYTLSAPLTARVWDGPPGSPTRLNGWCGSSAPPLRPSS